MAADPNLPQSPTEWRLSNLEAQFKEFVGAMQTGFSDVRRSIEQLQYVRQDLYNSEQVTRDSRIQAVADTAKTALKVTLTVLGMFCTVIVVAVIAFLVRVVGS